MKFVHFNRELKHGVETILTVNAGYTIAIRTSVFLDEIFHQYKTLVYESNATGSKVKKNWAYDVALYTNSTDAAKGHTKMIEKWLNRKKDLTELRNHV